MFSCSQLILGLNCIWWLCICIGYSMICSYIWHKYHEWYFEIVIRNLTSRWAGEMWGNFISFPFFNRLLYTVVNYVYDHLMRWKSIATAIISLISNTSIYKTNTSLKRVPRVSPWSVSRTINNYLLRLTPLKPTLCVVKIPCTNYFCSFLNVRHIATIDHK